jgi:putative serine protease PepD
MDAMNKPSRKAVSIAAALVGAAAIGAVVGAVTVVAVDDTSTVVREVTVEGSQPTAQTSGLSASQIYERANPSVVEITASGTSSAPFGGSEQQQALGSGFVYDAEGHIVTNEHVVDGADSVSVRFSNGSRYNARVVGTDPSTDLAVLKVDAPASVVRPLRLADSSDVVVGDYVLALGSPFGLEGTLTTGIVSALHRQIDAPNNFTINDAIQTDAAINHGNSGGPLLDDLGRVIGVNAQIESDSGGSDGVGFAIPSNTVQAIADKLIASGSVEHAYLGVGIREVQDGVAIISVEPGTPADDAGLKPSTGTETVNGQQVPTGGDVIVAIDGEQLTTSAELQSAIDAKQPGDTVTLTVERSGKQRTVEVTLATRPPQAQ